MAVHATVPNKGVSGSVVSLSNEDAHSFKEDFVTCCKIQVLSLYSSSCGLESPLSSPLSRIEYFEIVNDLKLIAETRYSVPSLLARWDGELSDSDGLTPLKLGNVTLAFCETIVGILRSPHAQS